MTTSVGTWARRIRQSPATYPTATLWVTASASMIALAQGWLTLGAALIIIGLMATLVIILALYAEMLAMRREVATVHLLVNSQRDLLLERIEHLVDALDRAGIDLPHTEPRQDREDRHE